MNKDRDSGFTLIEILGAIVVASFVMIGIMQLWQQYYGSLQQARAASEIQVVSDAARRYIRQRYEQLYTQSTQVSGPQITIDQLINDGYLPEGFEDTNLWRQTYTIYVRRTPADTMTALVLTYDGRGHEDGDPFATVTVPGAALRIDGAGGFVPAPVHGDADTLVSGSGGYIIDLPSIGIPTPGAGHLGVYLAFDEHDAGTDYLYRSSVPGHEELNQMATELDMTGHGIERVQSVHYVSREVNAGQTCSTADEGKMFLDEDQGMYLCRNGSLVLMSDTGNSAPIKSATIATNGQKITKPTCGATGMSPQIYVAPVSVASGASAPPLVSVQAWATSISSTQWQINLRLLNSQDNTWIYPAADYGKVMVFAMCQ